MCGFIGQLVHHCTGIMEVTGSNPVEALIFQAFFQLLKLGNLLQSSFLTLMSINTLDKIPRYLHGIPNSLDLKRYNSNETCPPELLHETE